MTRDGRIRDAGRMRAATRGILTITFSSLLVTTACSSTSDTATPATTAASPTTTTNPTNTTAATEPSTTTTSAATEPSTTTTSTPTTTETPTITEAPPSTTESTPTTTPPATNPDDPNWLEIVQALVELQHELREAPDSARIEEYCVGGENTCNAMQGDEIRNLESEGWRVDGAPEPEVLSVRVIQTADGAPPLDALWVLLEVETVRPDQTGVTIVDETGAVVFNLTNTGDSPTIFANFMVTSGGTNSWRVLAIEDLDPE